jgi:hypothetical protein
MTTVTVNRGSRASIAVNQGVQNAASVVVKRAGNITLQSLNNVDASDLQDGYTLIFDSDTNNFVTQPLANIAINFVDGGTY